MTYQLVWTASWAYRLARQKVDGARCLSRSSAYHDSKDLTLSCSPTVVEWSGKTGPTGVSGSSWGHAGRMPARYRVPPPRVRWIFAQEQVTYSS